MGMLGPDAINFNSHASLDKVANILEVLMSCKADINAVDREGETTVFKLVRRRNLVAFTPLASKTKLATTNKKGLTALHYAAMLGGEDSVAILAWLCEHANKLIEKKPITPLFIAAVWNMPDNCKCLVERFAARFAVSRRRDKLTPILAAARAGSTESLVVLLAQLKIKHPKQIVKDPKVMFDLPAEFRDRPKRDSKILAKARETCLRLIEVRNAGVEESLQPAGSAARKVTMSQRRTTTGASLKMAHKTVV